LGQGFGFIEQTALGRQLFGTGAKQTLTRERDLFDQPQNLLLRFALDGVDGV